MDCLEFRRRVGAEPSVSGEEIEAHRRECPACARHQDELRAMDSVIARALAVDAARIQRNAQYRRAADTSRRPRWLAIAASIVIGLSVGLALWISSPRISLAREVIGHVAHEPSAVIGTAPVAPAALDGVLDPEGARLRPGLGDVTFAMRCLFEGHVVPHLVVRTATGPVTVLLLRHRNVSEPTRVEEQGYVGVVLPAPRGSIAIVGREQKDLEGIAQQVYAAVDWGG
jgi:uncharacterized protein DUF3379